MTGAAAERERRIGFGALLRPHLWRLLGGTVCLVVAAAAGSAYAYFAGPLLQILLSGGRQGTGAFLAWIPRVEATRLPLARALAIVAATLVLLAAIRGLAHLGQTLQLSRLGAAVAHQLRVRTFGQLLALPLATHRCCCEGELLTRLLDDIERVQRAVVAAPLALIRDGAAALALLVVALLMSVRLTLVALVALPVVALLVALLFRRVRAVAARGQRRLGAFGTRALRGLLAIREVKSCRAEARELAAVAEQSAAAARCGVRREALRAAVPLCNEVLAAAALGGALIYAATLVAAGELASANLASFFTAALMLYRPVKGIGSALQEIAAGSSSVARVGEILAQRPEPEGAAAPLPPLRDRIAAGALAFRYPDPSAGWVLDGVSFELRRGEMLAVLGESGAGKSTLANVLAGLERWQRGTLLWDGVPLDPAEARRLRARAALLPQQPLVIEGSVADNLRYGAPQATEEQLWAALEAAALAPRVARFAAGLAQRLGADGTRLSVGEAQRLALARALLQRGELLILDEPSAALDPRARDALIETLRQLRRRWALLVLTHDRRLAAAADRVLELDRGRLRAADDPPRRRRSRSDMIRPRAHLG